MIYLNQVLQEQTFKQQTTMKNSIIAITLFVIASTLGIYMANNDSKKFTIKNNSTRDYQYEHYCDSIYEVNPDYYLDVLVETDEFQNYIDEHGEWWKN